MKRLFLLATLCCMAAPAMAGAFFDDSIEDRAAAINQQVTDHGDYYGYLAMELANVAEEEKSQHDISVAKYFIAQAEQAAAKSGAKK